ncbi:MAG: cytochrome c biogenesis protein CcdA [Elusimicrobiota bacterium]|jgi:cytochrome c-type biogenesis protein|nr:cytochrome c biogenesis protein CcdA [Elusimicrobiota bacterium]
MEYIEHISKFTSFSAGLLSFMSPCILPLIPSYISLIAGISIDDLQNADKVLKAQIIKTIAFILGFTAVFIILGMSAGWIGNIFTVYRNILMSAGGTLIIFFGLYISGLFKINFIHIRFSFLDSMIKKTSFIGLFCAGAVFALAWTPCVGPILAPILIMASLEGAVYEGFWLLLFYSLGLAIPFLLTAVFINVFFKFAKIVKRYYSFIRIIAAVILIITGILTITDSFTKFTNFYYANYYYDVDEEILDGAF